MSSQTRREHCAKTISISNGLNQISTQPLSSRIRGFSSSIASCLLRVFCVSSASCLLRVFVSPHRDFGGGVNKRTDAGWSVGLGAKPANALVLARFDPRIQVVGVKLVDPESQAQGQT